MRTAPQLSEFHFWKCLETKKKQWFSNAGHTCSKQTTRRNFPSFCGVTGGRANLVQRIYNRNTSEHRGRSKRQKDSKSMDSTERVEKEEGEEEILPICDQSASCSRCDLPERMETSIGDSKAVNVLIKAISPRFSPATVQHALRLEAMRTSLHAGRNQQPTSEFRPGMCSCLRNTTTRVQVKVSCLTSVAKL